jgi:hypothetical protein
VASELPPKSEFIQHIELSEAQRDLYETVRLALDRKVREEIARRGWRAAASSSSKRCSNCARSAATSAWCRARRWPRAARRRRR